jgi:hypothetical protein
MTSDNKATSYNDNPFGLGQAYIDLAHRYREEDEAAQLEVAPTDPASRHPSPCEE